MEAREHLSEFFQNTELETNFYDINGDPAYLSDLLLDYRKSLIESGDLAVPEKWIDPKVELPSIPGDVLTLRSDKPALIVCHTYGKPELIDLNEPSWSNVIGWMYMPKSLALQANALQEVKYLERAIASDEGHIKNLEKQIETYSELINVFIINSPAITDEDIDKVSNFAYMRSHSGFINEQIQLDRSRNLQIEAHKAGAKWARERLTIKKV